MCRLKTVICLASLLLLPAAGSAQQDVINTFAGGGPNNVPATSANVLYPYAVAFDSSGNYYFATQGWPQSRVFKVNTSGILSVLAGNGLAGYSGDGGLAPQAELNSPSGVAVDSSGNVYIADSLICIIRKVDTGGTISTFAGTGGACKYGGDGGAAARAYLNTPYGVAVDSSGNVYIADTDNYRIREVTVSNGEINTVAGTGTECTGGGANCGDGGPSTSAGISQVYSLAVDGSGNVYIPDFSNYEVRRFSVGGNIKTVAGNGTYCVPGGPFCGDGGLATSAELTDVYGIAVDSGRNIFIADLDNFRIREVTVSDGKINTVAGSGIYCAGDLAQCGDGGLATSAELSDVYGVGVDGFDDILIADYGDFAIREVTASNGKINAVAGNGSEDFTGDGIPATNAALGQPAGTTSDSSGNTYIADTENCVIREVNATTGNITTIAGTPGYCEYGDYGGDGGAATSTYLGPPSKVAVDAGNVYIADIWNCVIYEVDATGTITTFAGTPGKCSYGGDGGAARSAYLDGSSGVAVDGSGNVYIADTNNARIREVSGGIINTVAGNGSKGYSGDGGPATSAELDLPVDVALDASGNLYIADSDSNRIRMVNTSGIIRTFAGNGSAGFSGDVVPANESSVYFPEGVAVDPIGDVLIADSANNRIRWVDGQGIIYTVAGNGHSRFYGDGGLGTSAVLTLPLGVGVDPSGNIYIADTNNFRVRKVNSVAALNASPTNVMFPYQAVGITSSPQSLTLAAIGPLSIQNIAVTGDFSESNGCPIGTMVSGQCAINIVFKPTLAGVRTGTVTISDNGYFSPSLVISLQGTGIGMVLSPTALGFGPQDGGTTSRAKTLTLTNYAPSGTLTISSATISGVNASDFTISKTSCGSSLAANSSCAYDITFIPSLNGAESATLTVEDAYGTQTATLSGTGIGAGLAPAALVFAAQAVGTISAPQTLTLSNYLSSLLSLNGATIEGMNAKDFLMSTSCGSLLAEKSNCTYKIFFKPSSSGRESATLSVNDADGTQMAALTGTGVAGPIAPQ